MLNSTTDSGIGFKSIMTGSSELLSSFHTHPYSVGLGNTGFATCDHFQCVTCLENRLPELEVVHSWWMSIELKYKIFQARFKLPCDRNALKTRDGETTNVFQHVSFIKPANLPVWLHPVHEKLAMIDTTQVPGCYA